MAPGAVSFSISNCARLQDCCRSEWAPLWRRQWAICAAWLARRHPIGKLVCLSLQTRQECLVSIWTCAWAPGGLFWLMTALGSQRTQSVEIVNGRRHQTGAPFSRPARVHNGRFLDAGRRRGATKLGASGTCCAARTLDSSRRVGSRASRPDAGTRAPQRATPLMIMIITWRARWLAPLQRPMGAAQFRRGLANGARNGAPSQSRAPIWPLLACPLAILLACGGVGGVTVCRRPLIECK